MKIFISFLMIVFFIVACDNKPASTGFFDLEYPEKTNALNKDIKTWYLDGYKTGWSDVLKAVQIDAFEEKIREQRET